MSKKCKRTFPTKDPKYSFDPFTNLEDNAKNFVSVSRDKNMEDDSPNHI
jgi:hypothetical protein